MRRKKRKSVESMGDLNLTPIMNLMVTIIPMLLLSAVFVKLVTVDTTLPVFSDKSADTPPPAEDKQEKPKLGLSVVIREDGFVIAGQGGVVGAKDSKEGPSVAKLVNGDYDFTSLSDRILEIKNQYPDEWSVILIPEPATKFDVIVKTMDAVRDHVSPGSNGKAVIKKMFPNVVIGGGVL